MILRELWWKWVVWRHFDTVHNKAVQYSVQRKTIRSWVAQGIVRSFVEDGVTYVHREDCRRQYAKIEKQSKAQRRRYEKKQTAVVPGPMPTTLAELELFVKAGATVEEPEPQGDTDDDTRH